MKIRKLYRRRCTKKISEILAREPGLAEAFFEFVSECEPAPIDAIAVTAGPGLEPALWVGINFAKALALLWEKPIVAVNHMEGHIFAALAKEVSYDTANTP
jgi:O-sialoglycoprotein endopeptidase (EC 3.4.24.57)